MRALDRTGALLTTGETAGLRSADQVHISDPYASHPVASAYCTYLVDFDLPPAPGYLFELVEHPLRWNVPSEALRTTETFLLDVTDMP